MECIWLTFGLTTLILLISIFSNLNQIKKETTIIMSKQAEFNEQVGAINASLETLRDAIAAEGQQVRDAIAADDIDTSALGGVASRLSELAASVNDIVVEPADDSDEDDTDDLPSDEEPVDEPPADEAPVDEPPPTGDGR